jgi:hypothetical protein
MSSNKCIIPECYIDSCLVEVLLKADKNHVNHQKSNGKVANEMKTRFASDFCVGIIDEDREPLDYLKQFDVKKENKWLKLWKHKNDSTHHYVIQIRPVIEKWCLDICEKNEISVSDFKLPADLKSFLKVSKSTSAKNDVRFIGLFKKMKNQSCEPVMELKRWIEFLKENKQNTNLDLL